MARVAFDREGGEMNAAFITVIIVGLSAGIQAQAGEPHRVDLDALRHAEALRRTSPGTQFWTWWQTMFDDRRVAPWCDPTNPNYMPPSPRRPPCRPHQGSH